MLEVPVRVMPLRSWGKKTTQAYKLAGISQKGAMTKTRNARLARLREQRKLPWESRPWKLIAFIEHLNTIEPVKGKPSTWVSHDADGKRVSFCDNWQYSEARLKRLGKV